MNTRRFLAVVFLSLTLLSAIAYFWKGESEVSGKTTLVWATDQNPARIKQAEAFNRENPNIEIQLRHHNISAADIIRECTNGSAPTSSILDPEPKVGM